MRRYTIPGRDGELSAGNCGRNWIWYRNYAEGSKELEEILTDTAMQQHRHSIAPGQSRAEVWARQKRLAEEVLDKTSAQVVQKTKQPFLQAITEVLPQQACFLNQRLLLVGDAFATLRPLSGLGTGQAARSAILLKEVMLQQKTWEEYEVEVMQTAHAFGQIGVAREKALGLGVI